MKSMGTSYEDDMTRIGVGSRESEDRPSSQAAIVPRPPTFRWKAALGFMRARAAYRRYHGTYQRSMTHETWQAILLLLLLWGIYSIRFGELTASSTGDVSGLSITFVWAYSEEADRVNAAFAFAGYVLFAYLIITYQRALQLQMSFYFTVLVCFVLLVLAIQSAFHSDPEKKHLAARSAIVWAWVVAQVGFVSIGLFRKKMLPWLHQSGRVFLLWPDAHSFYAGAYEGLDEIWNKLPSNLRSLLRLEFEDKPIYSFTGTFQTARDKALQYIGLGRAHTAQYVGGLDGSGAPHGVGVWFDTFGYGEFLVGRFLHGMPVAPFRAKGHTGSGFIAYRLGVLSAREDGVASAGWVWPAYDASTTPLQVAVASAECCTSGLFYRGFPRIVWLQRPTPVEVHHEVPATLAAERSATPSSVTAPEAARSHSFGASLALPNPTFSFDGPRERPDTQEVTITVPGRLGTVPAQESSHGLALQSRHIEACGSGQEGFPNVSSLHAGPVAEGRSTAGRPTGDSKADADTPVDKPLIDEESSWGVACAPCRASTSRRRRRRPLWEPHVEPELQNVKRLSPWLFATRQSGIMTELGAMDARALQSGYDVILFVHGYFCSVENAVALVAQLLALGKFPGNVMPVIFSWPCTSSAFYPNSREVVRSQWVVKKLLEAIENLRLDGMRRLHLFGHSMGARIVAAAAPQLATLFPRLTDSTEQPPRELVFKYGPGTLELSSVTFLSPDLELGEFVGRVGPALRSVCPLITVYGDKHDNALGWAQFFNGLVFRLWPKVAPEGLLDTCVKMSISPGTSLGRHCNTIVKLDGEAMDVDVVVTTYLQSNVHNIRHNYFHLNREMVDDIRDVVVDGKRAAERSNRLEVSGNLVYGFLLAPSYVVAS